MNLYIFTFGKIGILMEDNKRLSPPIPIEKHWRHDPKYEEEVELINFKNQHVASNFKIFYHKGKEYNLVHTQKTVETKLKELNLYRSS